MMFGSVEIPPESIALNFAQAAKKSRPKSVLGGSVEFNRNFIDFYIGFRWRVS